MPTIGVVLELERTPGEVAVSLYRLAREGCRLGVPTTNEQQVKGFHNDMPV